MEQALSLLTIGLSHRTAPIDVREQYSISPADLSTCLSAMLGIPGVNEAFAVSTCNRTEIIVAADPGEGIEDTIARNVFRNIDREQLYVFRGIEAVFHLFRVTAGLDSVVLGESEILGQVKLSMQAASDEGAMGSELQLLLKQALRVGKRVRTETELGRGTLSVARVGVDVASHVFGTFEGCKALVVGAGETGVLTARHLKDKGIEELVFANRTLERARQAALEFHARAHPLEDLPKLTGQTDIILTCIDGTQPIIVERMFDRRHLARRDRPLLVVDLSVPRMVDPGIASIENVLLYNLDDLERVVEENERGRGEATSISQEILVAEVHKFVSLRTFSRFLPAIEKLRKKFERVREEVVDDVCGATADAKELEVAHELSRRLMDVALTQMKESARYARTESALDREYQRFLENL